MTFQNSVDWYRREDRHVENLGIGLSGGTFSVQGGNGSPLSARNPGYVSIPSKANPGRTVAIRVTANQTFDDANGTSTIEDNLFGFLAADTTPNDDVPFYIYAVLNDAETAVSFMISRQTGRTKSPVAASIGKTGSAVADAEHAFFALGNPTVANYDENPCVIIGSFRMRLTAADADWTVQALDEQFDGIGRYQEGKIFSLPFGIFGAAANTHWKALGGTAPVFGTVTYAYLLHPHSGFVTVGYSSESSVTVAGVGAVQAELISPFIGFDGIHRAMAQGESEITGATKFLYVGTASETTNVLVFVYSDASGSTSGNLNNGTITTNFDITNLSATYLMQMS